METARHAVSDACLVTWSGPELPLEATGWQRPVWQEALAGGTVLAMGAGRLPAEQPSVERPSLGCCCRGARQAHRLSDLACPAALPPCEADAAAALTAAVDAESWLNAHLQLRAVGCCAG